jgi:hypothetical protein
VTHVRRQFQEEAGQPAFDPAAGQLGRSIRELHEAMRQPHQQTASHGGISLEECEERLADLPVRTACRAIATDPRTVVHALTAPGALSHVRDLAEASDTCGRTQSPFGMVANPIRMMEREHQEVSDALTLIRELTLGYAAPADGCTTYAVAMEELQQFERDLHQHVHLENNVLFPAAMRIEGRRCGSAEANQ